MRDWFKGYGVLLVSVVVVIMSGCADAKPTPAPSKSAVATEQNQSVQTSRTAVLSALEYEASRHTKQCNELCRVKKAVAILIQHEQQNKEMNERFSSGSMHDNSIDSARLEALSNQILEIEQRLETLSKRRTEDNVATKKAAANQVRSKQCNKVTLYALDPTKEHVANYTSAVHPCPMKESVPSKRLKKGTIVTFRGCDIYGWCELADGSGFVAGYQYKPLKHPTKEK